MVFSIRRWTASAQGEIDGEEQAKLLRKIIENLAGRYPLKTPETDGKNRIELAPKEDRWNAGEARILTYGML